MAATTTTTFPSLSVSAPEDSMEIASPAQPYDGDIELDFGDDDYNGGVQIEDEHMLTDGEQTRPATATDDMMDDDLQLVQTHEADMQDTPDVDQQQQYEPADEELIDYGDDETAQDYTEDATLVNADDGFNTFQEHTEQADEEIVREPEDFFPAVDTELAATDLAAQNDDVVTVPNDDYAAAVQGHDHVAQESQAELFPNEDQAALGDHEATLATTADAFHEDHMPAAEPDQPGVQPALTLDTTTYPDYEQPATPTDTGLHPMTVYYGEHAMPLFKSKRQPEGLLKDDNLASLSLHELLTQCRERLVMKIGNIPEEQEFTLAFDHLGLLLVEVCPSYLSAARHVLTVMQNSRAAFEHSLNDVLEIYLQLHSNDGVTECPPLSLTLTHQQFSGQLALLKQAAQAGSGMSHFAPTNQDGEEYYEENEQHVENGEAYPEQEADELEQQNQEHREHEQQGYQEEFPKGEEKCAAQESYTQDAHAYEDQQYPEYAAEDAGEHYVEDNEQDAEAALSEQHAQEAVTTNDDTATQNFAEAAEVQDRGDVQDQAAIEHQTAQATVEAEDNVEHDASLNSSVTLQGDEASGTGESKYEDLIDWDDDSDLTGTSSDLPAEEADEFSTFIADLDAEQNHEAEHDQQPTLADDAGNAHGQVPSAHHDQALHLGSEDLLREEDFDPEAEEEVEPHDYEQENQQDGQHELYQDQADTHDKQQADQHDGAGEEAFLTTDEFANEETYEDGEELRADEETQATGNSTNTNGELTKDDHLDTLDLEDTIDFDDDTPAEYDARKASNPDISDTANGTNSPLGKRSFDEHNSAEDDIDFSDDDEPETKKVRSA